ncbi:MAG TPA: hypothetical protein VIV60_33420 [Polyangiaceae bacterium]
MNTPQLVPVDLGFSTADADVPELRLSTDCLILTFRDWRADLTEHRFAEVIAFRWAAAQSLPTPRDDAAYELLGSEWLHDELAAEQIPAGRDFAHYVICFNSSKTLEVLCRRSSR